MGGTDSDKTGKIVGIIGLGSIGIRHCEALQKLGVKKIIALRTGKGQKAIPETLNTTVFNTENIELFEEADCFLIANPTSLHIEALEKLIKFNKPIFIEKPLTDEINSLSSELIKKVKNFNSKIQIGFCLRYHPVIKRVKSILDNGSLGEIYYADLKVGQYLPQWHPYTDYRDEYYSRKDLGGGALRTLSHEIDLAQYFFGKPNALKSYVTHLSDLEINVDDLATLLLNIHEIKVKVEIDFLQKKPIRQGKILGTLHDLHYDVFNNKLQLFDNKGMLILDENVSGNDMYLEQMKGFLGSEDTSFATFEESITQMKLISASEEYSGITNWLKI